MAAQTVLTLPEILARQGTDPELRKLVAKFLGVVPLDTPFMVRAAKQAWISSELIWEAMKQGRDPGATRRITGAFAGTSVRP